ncbi:trypsin-like serine protease [Alloscardovia theropitheci]|uniref:Trypsin-like serine protease n=1 Tax=Alloscardovia theropitheci TaxID=2496842 RepID=A0A4R0QXW7_9BIFI|nr:trypsin-like peptidase domain-containing protein [Alloscardovia theropitheci]TCD54361.1 trypsin-like serine protease [Alloscardovia theropitheci]
MTDETFGQSPNQTPQNNPYINNEQADQQGQVGNNNPTQPMNTMNAPAQSASAQSTPAQSTPVQPAQPYVAPQQPIQPQNVAPRPMPVVPPIGGPTAQQANYPTSNSMQPRIPGAPLYNANSGQNSSQNPAQYNSFNPQEVPTQVMPTVPPVSSPSSTSVPPNPSSATYPYAAQAQPQQVNQPNQSQSRQPTVQMPAVNPAQLWAVPSQVQQAQPQTAQAQTAQTQTPMGTPNNAGNPPANISRPANMPNPFADPANASGTRASVTGNENPSMAHGSSNYGGFPSYSPYTNQKQSKVNGTTIAVAIVSAALAAILVAVLGIVGINSGLIRTNGGSADTSVVDTPEVSNSTGATGNWVGVARKVLPAVVLIRGQVSKGVMFGSGAFISKDGYIITNNHVVDGTTALAVTMYDGTIYDADIVGTDPSTDLAVIKLKNAPDNITTVDFANSDKLVVGQQVMAVGSPLGYQNTVTSGIISSLNRPVAVAAEDNKTVVYTNAIQVDASINQGNSGGPTFNIAGQLIGINSSIATASTTSGDSSLGSVGIGFAIPSNLAKWVSQSLMENKKATHVELGVSARTAEVESDGSSRTGAQLVSVKDDSAANSAGLKKDDVIVAYDGHEVNSINQLLGFIRAAQLNDKVTLTIVRGSRTMEVSVTLDHEESSSQSSQSSESNDSNSESNNDELDELLKKYRDLLDQNDDNE